MAEYRPMTLVDLAGHLSRTEDDSLRWRLIAEFLEEYRHEPPDVRRRVKPVTVAYIRTVEVPPSHSVNDAGWSTNRNRSR